jgi:hypothetical protein
VCAAGATPPCFSSFHLRPFAPFVDGAAFFALGVVPEAFVAIRYLLRAAEQADLPRCAIPLLLVVDRADVGSRRFRRYR